MIKLNCQHSDTCLPDYWRGHHLPHVSIPVYKTMSFKDVKQAIKSEIVAGAVCGSTNDARLLSWDFIKPEEEKRADALTRAVYAAINRDIKPAKKGGRRPFWNLEEESEDAEYSVYAYFVFIEC